LPLQGAIGRVVSGRQLDQFLRVRRDCSCRGLSDQPLAVALEVRRDLFDRRRATAGPERSECPPHLECDVLIAQRRMVDRLKQLNRRAAGREELRGVRTLVATCTDRIAAFREDAERFEQDVVRSRSVFRLQV